MCYELNRQHKKNHDNLKISILFDYLVTPFNGFLYITFDQCIMEGEFSVGHNSQNITSIFSTWDNVTVFNCFKACMLDEICHPINYHFNQRVCQLSIEDSNSAELEVAMAGHTLKHPLVNTMGDIAIL